MPEQNLRLVNETEAAAILGVSRKTLQCWRWRQIGVKWIKVGRLIRYKISDLEEYLDRQTKTVRREV